jgi:hypothetical protein
LTWQNKDTGVEFGDGHRMLTSYGCPYARNSGKVFPHWKAVSLHALQTFPQLQIQYLMFLLAIWIPFTLIYLVVTKTSINALSIF